MSLTKGDCNNYIQVFPFIQSHKPWTEASLGKKQRSLLHFCTIIKAILGISGGNGPEPCKQRSKSLTGGRLMSLQPGSLNRCCTLWDIWSSTEMMEKKRCKTWEEIERGVFRICLICDFNWNLELLVECFCVFVNK